MSTVSHSGSMLLFFVGPFRFCVDALEVEAVIEGQSANAIPLTPASVEGVFLFRERVTSVINLRKKFGLESLPDEQVSQMLVTVRDGEYVAYRVDEVFDLVGSAEIAWEDPEGGQAGGLFRFGTHRDEIVILIELAALRIMDESSGLPESLRHLVDRSMAPDDHRETDFGAVRQNDITSPDTAGVPRFRHAPISGILTETLMVPGEPLFTALDYDSPKEESPEKVRPFSRQETGGTSTGRTAGHSRHPVDPAVPRSRPRKVVPAVEPECRTPAGPAAPSRPMAMSRARREGQGSGFKLAAALAAGLVLAGIFWIITTFKPGEVGSPEGRERYTQSVNHFSPEEQPRTPASSATRERNARSAPTSALPAPRSGPEPGSPGPASQSPGPAAEAGKESPAEMITGRNVWVESGVPPDKPENQRAAESSGTEEILRVDTKDFTMTVERSNRPGTSEQPDTGQPAGQQRTVSTGSGTPETPGETTGSLPAAETIIHIVKKGDTLWDIAAHYLGNPFRYPELAHLSHIKDPHWIYPGDRVRIIPKTSLAYRSGS